MHNKNLGRHSVFKKKKKRKDEYCAGQTFFKFGPKQYHHEEQKYKNNVVPGQLPVIYRNKRAAHILDKYENPKLG